MPYFSKLPVLIIDKIIENSVSSIGRDLYKDKSVVACLHVCSLWRKIGVPKYYRHAYYHDFYEDEENPTITNINLVARTHNARRVERLSITVFHLYQMIELLSNYEALFQANNNDWSGVEKFEIHFYNDISIPDQVEYNGTVIDLQEKLLDFIKYLTMHMPNIVRARIFYLDITEATSLANAMFLSAYSRQLQCFSGDMISCFNNGYSFENLTFFELVLSPTTEVILPKLNCTQLKYLSLIRIPYTFQWNDLLKDRSIKKFEFKHLEYLTLFFFDGHDGEEVAEYISNNESRNRGFKFELVFPRLKSLFFGKIPSWFTLHTTYRFSDSLEKIVLNGAQAAYPLLRSVKFETVNIREFLSARQSGPFDTDFYLATNKLYGTPIQHEYSETKLHMWNTQKYIDWSQTRWTFLTSIEINECDVQTFSLFHRHCKALQIAHMTGFVVDIPLEESQSLFSQDGSSSMEQRIGLAGNAGKGLMTLTIDRFKDSGCEREDIDGFFMLYLRWATNLRHLKLRDDDIFDIHEFIDKNKKNYAHLGNVFISTSRWDY